MCNPEAWAVNERADRLAFNAGRAERAPDALERSITIDGQTMSLFRWNRIASKRVPIAGPKGVLR